MKTKKIRRCISTMKCLALCLALFSTEAYAQNSDDPKISEIFSLVTGLNWTQWAKKASRGDQPNLATGTHKEVEITCRALKSRSSFEMNPQANLKMNLFVSSLEMSLVPIFMARYEFSFEQKVPAIQQYLAGYARWDYEYIKDEHFAVLREENSFKGEDDSIRRLAKITFGNIGGRFGGSDSLLSEAVIIFSVQSPSLEVIATDCSYRVVDENDEDSVLGDF